LDRSRAYIKFGPECPNHFPVVPSALFLWRQR